MKSDVPFVAWAQCNYEYGYSLSWELVKLGV